MFLLAQGIVASWSIAHIAIMVVCVAAVVALVYIALQQFGVAIPQWVQSSVGPACLLGSSSSLCDHLRYQTRDDNVAFS